ncbi:MAG: phage tail protein [Leptolyngbyaceae cyanobacterium bins.302]|nr:phage tail protein [Leptolyngbyaceae cyanobacterium bins.302]
MTQTSYRPSLSLKLVSMQIPETVSWLGQSEKQQIPDNALLLIPGQKAEIAMLIENTGNTALQWQIEIRGEFPKSWCLWNKPDLKKKGDRKEGEPEEEAESEPEQERVREILPQEPAKEYIPFEVPLGFFESKDAIGQEQQTLQLNYQIEICLYTVEEITGELRKQLVGYQPFQLCVKPACSYINFLPEIYQTSNLLPRFLMLFEQSFDPTVQTLNVLWAYLNPLTTSKALLPFLARWLASPLDPRMTSKQQRRILRHAVTLYRWRGTRWGLLLYLYLYTDLPLQETYIPAELSRDFNLLQHDIPEGSKHISVVENFTTVFSLGEAQLNQNPVLGGGQPFHFVVTLRFSNVDETNTSADQSDETIDQAHQSASQPHRDVNPIDEAVVRDIIEQMKPAFCTYDLQIFNFV